MPSRNDFAVFVLSHGRPDKVFTVGTLRRSGYTGRIYIIIDDEDAKAEEYKKKFGDDVIQFSKAELATWTDTGDNNPKRNTVLFARNACWEIAERLGLKYFMQFDDDYSAFQYNFTGDLRPEWVHIRKTFDGAVDALIAFFERVPCLKTLATAQGGDFIGGVRSKTLIKRKAMNSFLCSVDRPFVFTGRMNDDVNTYVLAAIRGELMFTATSVSLVQGNTQQSSGGLTEMYAESGTYAKSFYTVMMAPSCVRVSEMGENNMRIHHKIKWANCAPKILRPEVRS